MTRTELIVTSRSARRTASHDAASRRISESTELDPVMRMSVKDAQAQVDEACREMEEYHEMEPDQILRSASRHMARLNTIRIRAMRIEHAKRVWKDLRVREIEPAVEELRRQSTIASRLRPVRGRAARTEPMVP